MRSKKETFNKNWPHVGNVYFTSGIEHHTEKYPTSIVVVRRGYNFTLRVDPSKDEKMDNLINSKKLFKVTGGSPEIKLVQLSNQKAEFEVPISSGVGSVMLKIGEQELPVMVIFNPYHPQDIVYMSNQKLLEEYIENEYGFVFLGDGSSPDSLLWEYGQFSEETILPVVFYLLDIAKEQIDYLDLSDPRQVSRVITWLINTYMLTGNWSDQNPDGTPEVTFGSRTYPKISCKVNENEEDDKWRYYSSSCDYTQNELLKGKTLMPFCRPIRDNICEFKSKKYVSIKLDGDGVPLVKCSDSDCSDYKLNDYKDKYKNWDLSDYDATATCTEDPEEIFPDGKSVSYCRKATDLNYTGSPELFRIFKYNIDSGNDRGLKVQYAQCWIFGGVLNTMCRALGIPARQVSNFGSSHPSCDIVQNCEDGQGTFTQYTFKVFDKSSKSYDNAEGNYIWNFHSWNDVWMRRPDLMETPYEGEGWQAIDATPQELSFGRRQMGPAPLKAIKAMDFLTPKDTSFVIGEVNYKVVYFQKDNTKFQDGSNVTGDYDIWKEDIADVLAGRKNNYIAKIDAKDGDSRPVSTQILLPAEMYSTETKTEDVILEISNEYSPKTANALSQFLAVSQEGLFLNISDKNVGQPVSLDIMSYSFQEGTVDVEITITPVLYTNKAISGIQPVRTKQSIQLVANKYTTSVITLSDLLFDIKVSQYFSVNIAATFPNKQLYTAKRSLHLDLPPINIVVEKCCNIPLNKPTKVVVSFTNPFKDQALTNVKLSINVAKLKLRRISGDDTYRVIKANQTIQLVFQAVVTKVHPYNNKTVINAILSCDQFGKNHSNGSQVVVLSKN